MGTSSKHFKQLLISASSDRTPHLVIRTISGLAIETGEARPALRHARSLAAQLAVDGSTELSAHRFRSSGVRNVAIDQLLLSSATVLRRLVDTC